MNELVVPAMLTAEKPIPEGIGGKARNLLQLEALGLKVPPFVVVPSQWFETLCGPKQRNAQGVPLFDQIEFPAAMEQAILARFEGFKGYFAVRSSYRDEDAAGHSFAGQFTSRLFVPAAVLGKAILEVWSSSLSEHLAAYQASLNLEQHFFLSVIVQEMVDAEISGVAFSMNPLTGHRQQKVVNAVFGLGEGLVSGDLEADQFLITQGQIERKLAQKTHAYRFNAQEKGGLIKQTLQPELSTAPTLSNAQLRQLEALLNKLKAHFDKHQDIEFAFVKDQLFLLQARPVTALHRQPDVGGRYIVWDNSNIIESYPGITSPLTFSYILKLYEKAYRQFVGLMGVSPRAIDRNAEDFAHMLGLLNGRIYYNLRSWYKMISMLPGYSFNARFMEQMMGVKERFDLDPEDQRSKLGDFLRILRMLGSILYNLSTLEAQKRRFVSVFEEMEATYKDLDPESLTANELMQRYKYQETKMLQIWKAPLVNDFFAMIYFGLLKKQMTTLFGEQTNVHNDVLIGGKSIITTKPAELITEMVQLLYADPALKALFAGQAPQQILKALEREPRYGQLRQLVEAYIDQFGDRMVGELKLETRTYRQEPALFIEVLQAYVQQDLRLLRGGKQQPEIALREEAERKIREKLKRRPIRYWWTRHVLKRARQLVAGRENLRLYRTRAFGGARTAFTQIGKIFYREDLLEQPRDIFYLTKEEIFNYIDGTSVNYDLKALVGIRRAQFGTFAEEPLQSERIKTHGMVYLGNSFFQEPTTTSETGDLEGIGCCKGVVRGRVKVVRRPEEVYQTEGDILVTTSTDPGWVTIFPSISGILVERGSLLSHAAIVSREMGIPCIVGISGLTRRLKTGDLVEMDGERGIVNILEHHEG